MTTSADTTRADRRQEMARELADMKAALQSRILDLVRVLGIDGSRAGAYWIGRNPTRDDRHAGSFWVLTKGVATGGWKDEATGEKGDVFSLIGYCKGLEFRDAVAFARDFLGWQKLDNEAIKAARAAVKRSTEQDEAREARILAENRRRAQALWLKGVAVPGTPADRYLRTRGIDVRALQRMPGALRCGTRKHLETGQHLPCLLSMMTTPDETFGALHCTFLAPDGSGKADVTPARKIWPSFKGCCIRLSRGETGLPIASAASQGLLDTLVLCEGVEDGLSIALACPEYRVWAAGSLGNLAHVVVPPTTAEVIVAADNDWGKPQAQRQLDGALEALSRQCSSVRVARSFTGKDMNDALRGAA